MKLFKPDEFTKREADIMTAVRRLGDNARAITVMDELDLMRERGERKGTMMERWTGHVSLASTYVHLGTLEEDGMLIGEDRMPSKEEYERRGNRMVRYYKPTRGGLRRMVHSKTTKVVPSTRSPNPQTA